MSRPAWFFIILAATSVAPSATEAQIRVAQEVEFAESFGFLSSVRELPDGRVLAADPLEQRLAAIDMDAGTVEVWGAQGSGAQQYRQPDAVFALPGDSTLLVDLGNSRLTVIAPDGTFARRSPLVTGSRTPVLPRTVDGQGRLYFAMRNMQNFSDSSRIGRVELGASEIGTIAKYQPRAVQRVGGGGRVSIEPVPMSPEDDWAAGADGTVAIVRADGYFVEVVHPDGSVSRGPEVEHRQIRPGDAEKQAWLDAPPAGPSVMMTMGGGAPSMQFSRGRGGNPASIDDLEWPEFMPSFRAGSTRVDPEGRIWVGRHTRAGEPSVFDIFDGEGIHTGQVTLDPNSSVVGFGDQGALYTARIDDDGAHWLQRWRMS